MRRLLLIALLLLALPAQAVTRLYFGGRYFPGESIDEFITPAADAGWEDATEMNRSTLHRTPLRARSQPLEYNPTTLTVNSANQDAAEQYQILLPTGTTFTSGVTTVTMQGMMRENVGTGDVNQCILGIRVIDADGSTVNATLLAVANYGTATELLTTRRNKTCANGDTVTSTYVTGAGDWLIVEQGFQNDGATGAATIGFSLLSDGSGYISTLGSTTTGDCPVDETTTTCTGWIEFSNTWTTPADAGPATRFWFPASGAADVSPAVDGNWSASDEVTYLHLSGTTKGSSALAEGPQLDIPAVAFSREVERVYVGDQMTVGTVFTEGQTTVSGQIMAREIAASDDVAGPCLTFKIVDLAGTTVRAELLDFPLPLGHIELTTTATNRPLARGTAVVASYTTVSGDRPVFEVGFCVSNIAGSPRVFTTYGENDTDCTVDFTDTTCAGWVQVSNAITFVAPTGRTPRVIAFLMADPLETVRDLVSRWSTDGT